MSDEPSLGNGPDPDDILSRAYRGDASADELRHIADWREASAGNDQSYRRTLRLLQSASALADASTGPIPNAAELLAHSRTPRQLTWRTGVTRLVPWAVAAAAVITLMVMRGRAPAPPQLGLADVVTGESEMTTLVLQDGSVVRLAPASQLKFVASDTAREVRLEGRAFFAVAPLPGKSFVVHTAGGDAKVLGTRFEISTDKRDLRLLVVEGRVALSSGGKRVEVSGGEMSGVRDAVMLTPVRVSNAERMDEWVGKFMVFQATTMREAATQIERMYGMRVQVDSLVAGRTVSATFTDRTVEEVLDVICSVTHTQFERQSGGIVISAKQ
jgi:transmembrane sensor